MLAGRSTIFARLEVGGGKRHLRARCSATERSCGDGVETQLCAFTSDKGGNAR